MKLKRTNILFLFAVFSVVVLHGATVQSSTSPRPNDNVNTDSNAEIDEGRDNTPDGEPEVSETPESDGTNPESESEDLPDSDGPYPEDASDEWESSPEEEQPFVENGWVNLPFDFDGPIDGDIIPPGAENTEPEDAIEEPENTAEHWWENDPEYFYDDEYAYLVALAEGKAEPEGEYNAEGEAESESEAESETEVESENQGQPEVEYVSSFKGSNLRTGTKRILKIAMVVLSIVCGTLGAVLLVLTYKSHKQYREAKLEKLEDVSRETKTGALWELLRNVPVVLLAGRSEDPKLTSHVKTDT